MVDPITAAAASAVASKGVEFGLNKLFGDDGDTPTARDLIAPFSAGGINARFGKASKGQNPNKFFVTSSAERKGLINSLRGNLLQTSSALQDARPGFQQSFDFGRTQYDNLLGQVTPGFGRLTDAVVQTIGNARDRTIGNLNDELRRRRVQGSSFANDSVARAELDFSQQEQLARAESFLAEMDMYNNFLQQRLQFDIAGLEQDLSLNLQSLEAARAADEISLNEMNMLAEIALQATSQATAGLSNIAAAELDLAAANATGQGAFIGDLSTDLGNAFTDYMNNRQSLSNVRSDAQATIASNPDIF